MKKVKCPDCGRISEIENPTPGMVCENCSSKLIGENAKISDVCYFCQKEIRPHEAEIFCPGCGKEYHADCWLDNDGCGVDGCAYQDYLAPMEIPVPSESPVAPPSPVASLSSASTQESIDPMKLEAASADDTDGEYFAIPESADAPQKTAQDEEKLFEEKMAAIRKHEAPAENDASFSWQEIMDWKNTPRDTKYDFDGPWFKDPYLLPKAKNYAIFVLGGAFGGVVLGFSLVVFFLLLKWIVFHSGLSFGFMVFLLIVGILLGIAAAVYFAYRTMATLIDN